MNATVGPSASPTYTGTQINYYLVCPRKLWLFSHDLTMEHTSELVELGRLLHETAYARERKELLIERIKIDFASGDGVIHEVKKGRTMERAHRFQLLYYLYYLKRKGISDIKGELHYPKLRRKEVVELTPQAERELEDVLREVEQVLVRPRPPARLEKRSVCRQCSYFELCYV